MPTAKHLPHLERPSPAHTHTHTHTRVVNLGLLACQSFLSSKPLPSAVLAELTNQAHFLPTAQLSTSAMNTLREGTALISAPASCGSAGVYGILKFESGVHRVQVTRWDTSAGDGHRSSVTEAGRWRRMRDLNDKCRTLRRSAGGL